MRKSIIVILVVLLLIAFGIWLWSRSASTPAPTGNVEVKASEVIVSRPMANEVVKSPLEVTGQAKGNWFFEATLPVRLEDANGNVIAAVQGRAQSNWMTEQLVPFTATLTFSTDVSSGFLVISKDNPSGLPENAASVKIPVNF